MNLHRLLLIAGLCLAGATAGCALKRHPTSQPTTSQASARDPKADLALGEIEPLPVMPAPATQPTSRPSLDAIEFYARARDALLENQRFTAIAMLKRAVAADPASFELRRALARAYLGSGGANDDAIAALNEAARIKPDDLEVQSLLGRQYLAKQQVDKAIEHFRLGMQTEGYKRDEETAAIVDLFLARALQTDGYDKAALQEYDRLLQRLSEPGMASRGSPELLYLSSRVDLLDADIGRLHEKRGEYPQALKAFEAALGKDPTNFELQARVVKILIAMRRFDDATARAAGLVTRFRANADSLALLRDAYRASGREDKVIGELQQLRRQRPADRFVALALSEMLRDSKRDAEADAVLSDAIADSGFDLELVKRLFASYEGRNDTEQGARLLINTLAAKPDSLRELTPMWSQLLRPGRKNRVRLITLQNLRVPPQSEASRLFWVSRVAELWDRDAVATSALEQAVKLDPPLGPAYRMLLQDYWHRPQWDDKQKADASEKLAAKAEPTSPALAAELRAFSLLNQKKPTEAAEAFERAMKIGESSPDLQVLYANILRAQGKDARAEQLLWKIVSDRPTYEDAWATLFSHYLDKGARPQAQEVLSKWLNADPTSVDARLTLAVVSFQIKQVDVAEKLLAELFKEHSDNVEVLNNMQSLYSATGRLEEFITKLEDDRAKEPENQLVVEKLVDVYASQKRLSEAVRVLDETRKAIGKDPDLLYYIAHLYSRIDEKQSSDEILQEVLRIEPNHAAASNDLGYSWADQGKNLAQAETLIRVAVQEEPDNPSFLDSLGWVLYKRGNFSEARKYLRQAVDSGNRPDPVVLDHMADVTYRAGDLKEARALWKRSLERLAEMNEDREDLRQLRLQLQQKLKQAEDGQPVKVAPTTESSKALEAKK